MIIKRCLKKFLETSDYSLDLPQNVFTVAAKELVSKLKKAIMQLTKKKTGQSRLMRYSLVGVFLRRTYKVLLI